MSKKVRRELIILFICFIMNVFFMPHVEASTYWFTSKQEETHVGDEYAHNIEAKNTILYDHQFARVANQVTYNLVKTIDNPRYDYRTKVIDDGYLNAYSVPGGHIYVTYLMMQKLKTYDEVAFVIGHELGHDMNEHWMQSIEKQYRAQIGAILIGKTAKMSNNQIQWLMTAAFVNVSRGYGFQKEHEADKYGFDHATAAGYNAGAGAMFFWNLIKTEQGAGGSSDIGSKIGEYLHPHPKTDVRLSKQLEYMKAWSKDHVEIKGTSIFIDGKFFMNPGGNAKYDSHERTYYIAGNIAREYHDKAMVMWWVNDKGQLVANDTVIFSPYGTDEDVNTVLDRVRK